MAKKELFERAGGKILEMFDEWGNMLAFCKRDRQYMSYLLSLPNQETQAIIFYSMLEDKVKQKSQEILNFDKLIRDRIFPQPQN